MNYGLGLGDNALLVSDSLLELVWISMIERERENFVLNEAFFIGHSSAMADKKNEVQCKICRSQPIDGIPNKLLAALCPTLSKVDYRQVYFF
jgi:hypothetical protein